MVYQSGLRHPDNNLVEYLTSNGTIVSMNLQENGMSRRDFLRIGSSAALVSVASLAIPGLEYPIQIKTESPTGIPQVIQYKPDSSISEISKLLSLLKHQSSVDTTKYKEILSPDGIVIPYQFGPNGVSIAWLDAPLSADAYYAQINFTDVLHPNKGIVLTGITNDSEQYGENRLFQFTFDFWGTYYEIQGGENNPYTSVCTAQFSDHLESKPAEYSFAADWRRKMFLPAVPRS